MHVLLTGANGFIGRALTTRLLDTGRIGAGHPPFERLTLADLRVDDARSRTDPRVRLVEGSIADAPVRERALDGGVDVLFHLASVTSRGAEEHFELGRDVNLLAVIELFDALRRQPRRATVVFSSSIAVFGAPLPPRIDDATPLAPALSYGAHKQIGEVLLADYTRRDYVDGRAVRLPGIVARPSSPNAAFSAFNSELIRRLAAGEPYTCPVSESATLWMMSLPCCVDNLLHAALSPTRAWPAARAVTLPALVVSVGALVDALAQRFGEQVREQLSYQPDAKLEAQFGRLPPLNAAHAESIGFRHDGDLQSLIAAALETA